MKTEKPNKNTFLKIPTDLARRTDLNWTEKALAAQLMSHGRKSSKIFPGQAHLRRELGIQANKTISRAAKRLTKTGDFTVRRVGNRLNNEYLPSRSMAKLFDYEGETSEAVIGQDDRSEPCKVTGQKEPSDRTEVIGTTRQSVGSRPDTNGGVIGHNDPLIDSINISIPREKCNTSLKPGDNFEIDLGDFIFESDANANVNGGSNKSVTGDRTQ